MTTMKGSCLCGSITFESDAEATVTGICDCARCRKQGGGAFSINLAVPRASLRISGSTLKTFHDLGDGGAPVQRVFCRNCGSPIVAYSEGLPEMAFIPAGTLEDTAWIKPAVARWCASAQPWAVVDPPKPRAPRNPSPRRERRHRPQRAPSPPPDA